MKQAHIKDFVKGWFVGNFEPSLLQANFEVGFHQHTAGEFHKDTYKPVVRPEVLAEYEWLAKYDSIEEAAE